MSTMRATFRDARHITSSFSNLGRYPFSHETICSYVYSPDGQSQALARYLPDRRKKRRPRYARTPRGMMFPLERSIHNRPEHIKDRSAFGDWEGDLMIFRREHGKTDVNRPEFFGDHQLK